MRWRGRERSDNVVDRSVPRKVRKTNVDGTYGDIEQIAEDLNNGSLRLDDVDRALAKHDASSKVKFGYNPPDKLGRKIIMVNTPSKINAADKSDTQKAVPLPRKRPDRDPKAPVPKQKPRRFKKAVQLK